jgi:hypothetical protein
MDGLTPVFRSVPHPVLAPWIKRHGQPERVARLVQGAAWIHAMLRIFPADQVSGWASVEPGPSIRRRVQAESAAGAEDCGGGPTS